MSPSSAPSPLRQLLEDSRTVVFLSLDSDLVITQANTCIRSLLQEDPTGRPFTDILVDFTLPPDLRDLIERNEDTILLNIATPSGSPRSFSFRFPPHGDGYCCFGEHPGPDDHDIQQHLMETTNELGVVSRMLFKANAELARINEEKNHLLGMAAHDLRNPIGGIRSLAKLILMDNGSRQDERELIQVIADTSDSMLSLLSDILDVAALESGKLTFHPQPCQPDTLIVNAARMNRLRADAKNITIRTDIPEPLPVVSLDQLKMQQVLDNLLSNAIKFSPEGGTVLVRGTVEGGCLHLSVRDQGKGVAEEDLPNLFKPFRASRSRGTGGEASTGLGLTIVLKIVEGHGGRIDVKSTPGRGAAFSVILPLDPGQGGKP